MAIGMPDPAEIPDGPHRDLLVRLHSRYDDAGRPAARAVSRHADRLRDREKVSADEVVAVLTGRSIPSWRTLEALVTALCQMSTVATDQRQEVVEVAGLWLFAREQAPATTPPPEDGPGGPPETRLDELRATIEAGRFDLVAAALDEAERESPALSAGLREELGFLTLPPVDRGIVAALWSQLTTWRDDTGPALASGPAPSEFRPAPAPHSSGSNPFSMIRALLGVEMPVLADDEWADVAGAIPGEPGRRCHVIFVNSTKPLDIATFAPELVRREAALVRAGVDVLVVVSAAGEISAELREVERDWDDRGAYPFRICLFGAGQIEDPTMAAFVAGVRATGRRRVVLPDDWLDYVRVPSRLCLRGESAAALDEVFDHQLPLRAINEAGALLDGRLLDHVQDWLFRPGEPTLLLLGDFGDGKSFFTYSLARQLGESAAVDDGIGEARVPLRLALAELPTAGSARELLRRRLEDLGIDLASWRRLAAAHPTLVVLDGFDEMSGELTRAAMVRNTELLRDCCEEFAGSKILITSRANVFGTADDQRQILERIGEPRTLRLAAVERREVLRSLRERTDDPRLQAVIDRLQTLHDPIGLATKPLYYEMIQRTLPSLPDTSFDEHVLYEKYVRDTLHRKLKLLEDDERRTPPGDVVANLMTIMEQVAVDLQRSDVPYVCLRDLDDRVRRGGGPGAGLAHLLWRLRDDPSADLNDDATARVAIRSLLKRAPGGDETRWPVTFFHRSVQEYFVARGVARAVSQGPDRAWPLLAEAPLSPEVRHFVVLILQASGTSSGDTLTELGRRAKLSEPPTAVGGNALSLIAALGAGPGGDWSGLLLDHADLRGADLREVSFRDSSLRGANLDNTDLTDADLRGADLTGVRLEETAAVTAVAAAGDGPVFAAYSDGRVREWSLDAPGAGDEIVGSLHFVPDRLWLTPGGAVVASGSAQVAVFHRDPGWRLVAQFRTQSRYLSPVWGNGRSLVVAENDAGARFALWQSGPPAEPWVIACPAAVGWAVDGDQVVAIAGDKDVVVTVRHDAVSVPVAGPRCVDVRRAGSGIELLVGAEDGWVTYLSVDRPDGGWRHRTVWRTRLHDGPVESVAFLGGDRLVSGSRDRSICVTPLSRTREPGPADVVRLHVKFRCRGIKIDGVRGDREHAMLSRLRED